MVWGKSHTGINLQGTAEQINLVPKEGHYRTFWQEVCPGAKLSEKKNRAREGGFQTLPNINLSKILGPPWSWQHLEPKGSQESIQE